MHLPTSLQGDKTQITIIILTAVKAYLTKLKLMVVRFICKNCYETKSILILALK
jgi:hypothetical protein